MVDILLKRLYGLNVLRIEKSTVGAGSDTYFAKCAEGKVVVKFPSVSEINDPESEPKLCEFLLEKGINVCEFIRNKDGNYLSSDDSGRAFHVQKFIEGRVYELNSAPDWLLSKSAEMLGKIHTALKAYEGLPVGIGADFFRRFERLRDIVSKKHSKVKCNSKVPLAAFKVTRDYLLSIQREAFDKDIMENMKRIQDMSGQYEGLNVILPLIMFKAVTGNVKSFVNNSNNVLTVDIRKLLNRRTYNIHTDNGKNFVKFEKDVKFFMALTKAYSKQFAVDVGFCYYCFGRVTNLPEWAAEFPLGNDFESAYLTAPIIAQEMMLFTDDETEYCCKKRGVDTEILSECYFNTQFGEIVGGSDSFYDRLSRYCKENPTVKEEMHCCFLNGNYDRACEISENIGTALSDSCVTLNKENFDYGVCYIYEYFLTDEIIEIRKLMVDTLNKHILLIDDK